ncbi:MAG: 4Fe-4S dicluster domain-containing protein [Actinobacteria bacterium]|nr:MAG: 4Fe-4S dicluster domain-containing protein [Actinomycetota bacterium]
MSFFGSGILESMRIAFRNLTRPVITVQYPHEKVELPERARWAVTMTPDSEGDHKCTACMACEKACPDFIIEIVTTTDEARNKHIDHWRYEIGACMMCGLCVEACPFDAIHMGHDYELARTDAATLRIDLLTDTPAAKPKRTERPAAAAKPTPEGGDADA